jgi:hypothetical protein
MNIPAPFLTPAQTEIHRRRVKRAWFAYGAAFLAFFVLLSAGEGLAVVGWLVLIAIGIWLAVVVSCAATAKGLVGPLWGLGTLALGPVGAILFPWFILVKL